MGFTKDYGYVDLIPANPPEPITKVEQVPPPSVETVKFDPPPIYKPKSQRVFFIKTAKDNAGKFISKEDRYIVINGKPVADISKFYGAVNTTSILILDPKEAQKKYGIDKGKNGAVEIKGNDIKYPKSLNLPAPPPPKVDQIKFPPPIVVPDKQTSFYPKNEYSSKTNKAVKFEKRYIVINGESVEDNSTFYGVSNTKSVKYLNQSEAIKKYGKEKGKNGAIEITGDNIQYAPKISPPPPSNTNSDKLKKVVLLAPPPPIKNKDANKDVYHIDVDLDRTKGDKLMAPESEQGKKTVSIYSDRGEKVYISSDYKNDWDGKLNTFSKKTIAAGNYSYELMISQPEGKNTKVIRGYISVK
jgi:hypothetical protein